MIAARTGGGHAAMGHLDVDGTRVRLYREGDGAGHTVVYLHSASGEICGLPFFTRLAAAGHRILVPELPGCGGSPPPKEDWQSLDDALFHLRRTLDLLSADKAVLIGASLGGWLAAELAVWFPERVRALVLLNAVGLRVEGAPVFNIFGVPGYADHQAEVMRRANPHNVDFLSLLRPSIAPSTGDPEQDTLLHFIRGQTVAARLGWNPFLHDPKLRSRLHAVRAPTLVLWGKDDQVVPLAHGEAYRDGIPGARLELVERCGHLPALEQPEVCAAHVNRFLATIPAS